MLAINILPTVYISPVITFVIYKGSDTMREVAFGRGAFLVPDMYEPSRAKVLMNLFLSLYSY
jgi:hypothetical protein